MASSTSHRGTWNTSPTKRRIEKAFHQGMILLEAKEIVGHFRVQYLVRNPTSGKEYKVKGDIKRDKSMICTCPDFQRRQQPCKHIFFLTRKIKSISTIKPLTFGTKSQRRPTEPTKLSTREEELDDCAICLEEMDKSSLEDSEIYECSQCHKIVHLDCFLQYCKSSRKSRCVYCRAD